MQAEEGREAFPPVELWMGRARLERRGGRTEAEVYEEELVLGGRAGGP